MNAQRSAKPPTHFIQGPMFWDRVTTLVANHVHTNLPCTREADSPIICWCAISAATLKAHLVEHRGGGESHDDEN